MTTEAKTILNKRDWRFITPLVLGIFLLLNVLVFIILNGGRWFEEIDPSIGIKPKYYNDLNKVFGPLYMLGYFTVQTNVFTGIMLVLLPIYYSSKKVQSWFVGSVSLISITFLVFWLLLAPGYDAFRWNSPYFTISNLFIHGINPIFSFVILILIRKEIEINKRTLGLCSLWMAVFYIYSAIFYGASSTSDLTTGKIDGSSVYSFLDIQKLFFIDLSNNPVLSIFLNILLLIACPFLPILVSMFWLFVLKIKTNDKSYFAWMDIVKQKYWKRKTN